jgi:hypothetical protein
MAQLARASLEGLAVVIQYGSLRGDAARTWTRGIHDTFELVVVACFSYDVFASASEAKI